MGSYRDFCSRATKRGFRIMDPAIDVFGETAIATYSYEISYELDGEGFDETGRDVFVFVREGSWWAVWRTLIPAAV